MPSRPPRHQLCTLTGLSRVRSVKRRMVQHRTEWDWGGYSGTFHQDSGVASGTRPAEKHRERAIGRDRRGSAHGQGHRGVWTRLKMPIKKSGGAMALAGSWWRWSKTQDPAGSTARGIPPSGRGPCGHSQDMWT